MLHLCVRHKEGYEVEVLVNEYTQCIASWLIGSYLTTEKRDRHTLLWLAGAALMEYGEYEYRDFESVHRMLFVLPMTAPLGLPEALGLFDTLSSKDVHPSCRKDIAKELREFIKKELSCLTTSTIPNTTPGSRV